MTCAGQAGQTDNVGGMSAAPLIAAVAGPEKADLGWCQHIALLISSTSA
jgi:hypothetical protein